MDILHTDENSMSVSTANINPDFDIISEVLRNFYLKGIYEGDLDLLKQVYHPGTLLFGDVKGTPYFKTLGDYLQVVGNRISPKDSGKAFQGAVVSIKIINSIAVAELKVRMYDFYYHEFLSFHRLEGKWLIVNKMMSDLA